MSEISNDRDLLLQIIQCQENIICSVIQTHGAVTSINKIQQEEILKFIDSFLSDRERKEYADYIINRVVEHTGIIKESQIMVANLHASLKRMKKQAGL